MTIKDITHLTEKLRDPNRSELPSRSVVIVSLPETARTLIRSEILENFEDKAKFQDESEAELIRERDSKRLSPTSMYKQFLESLISTR